MTALGFVCSQATEETGLNSNLSSTIGHAEGEEWARLKEAAEYLPNDMPHDPPRADEAG